MATDQTLGIINQKSLREQVYEYLRDQMNRGGLVPGTAINLNTLTRELGVSKTPLRDALIQLETEGFVTIYPRRGVFVNRMSLEDIRNAFQIIGSLEVTALREVYPEIGEVEFTRMKSLNERMIEAIKKKDFERYYRLNVDFHDVFLEMVDNDTLKRIVTLLKLRLYDFPRRGYIAEWELRNCEEHAQFIGFLENGDLEEAVHVLRDVHWAFVAQEEYIRKFYVPRQ